MFFVLFFAHRANISTGWHCCKWALVSMISIGIIWYPWPISFSYLDSVVPLSKWILQIFVLWGGSTAAVFTPSTSSRLMGRQTDRQTDCTWQSLFYKSFYNMQREKKLKNSFVTHQGNWKPSKDPVKSPCQFLVRHKVQTWLPSALLFVFYLFTKFAVPLGSLRPAVRLMLCKRWKLWSVKSGRSI